MPVGRKTYVYDPQSKKVVEKSELIARNTSAAVHTMQPFVSPIDGSVIRSPAQLAAHNRKHGVTDRRDYGPDWFERKRRELELKRQSLDSASKRDRIEALKRATEHVRT